MTESELSRDEALLLKELIARRAAHLREVVNDLLDGRKLTADQADDLRGAIADELVDTGIDPATEAINSRGESLDLLIDRIANSSEAFDR